MKKQLKGSLLLLLTAMIWGAAFVAQSVGMDYVGPFTFQAMRQLLGAAVLLPIIFLRDRAGSDVNRPRTQRQWLILLGSGLVCGVILFASCTLQQFGLLYTTPGKSGFITALYIILVPIASLFLGKRGGAKLWIAVVLALVGLYFLCMDGDLSLGKGELLTLLCAVCFTFHILFVDYISPKVDAVRLSAQQFFVCGAISIPCMFLTEDVSFAGLTACWLPICYAGILSCGVGYTLQIVAQRDANPTLASILMSMESVFAVLFGWLLLGDKMGLQELAGCGLMFTAIILAQLPQKNKK